MIPRLYFITHHHAQRSHADLAYAACRGGAQWLQLRVKDSPLEVVRNIAIETLAICNSFGVKMILNDYVLLAQELGAHGVHLGQEDMPVWDAKKLLGAGMLVGGTANTFEQILQLHSLGADYIGLGPFRHTATKEKLSPVLGLEGFRNILQACQLHGINIPIFAIGGILQSDVKNILDTGVYGVAVASAIGQAKHPEVAVCDFLELIDTVTLNDNTTVHGRTYN